MADAEPRAGELTTANYGWTKPNVGNSDDAWGGMLNADLDGIDSTVKSVSNAIPAASSTTPVMSGAGAVGTGTTWARADHQHPSDTSRYAATNPSGYQTAAQVTAAVPVASSTTPAANGTAAVGVGTTWARADHVHPTDTSGWLGDNRIINGDMRIDQRNNGASGTAVNVYTIDRWKYFGSVVAKGTWGRNLNAASGPVGFPYYLGFQSSSAYTPVTTDSFQFFQAFEGDVVSDFAWGTASAQSVTLSFWAQSSLTGTFGGTIGNWAATRSYPFSYSIPATNTWTKIIVTIPGDTAGAWVMSGNAAAVWVVFDLGSGPTKRGPANAWASADYEGVTSAVSVVATNAATFYVTGVKLEVGSVATPFNRQSLAKSMADCQRYYQTFTGLRGINYAGGTGSTPLTSMVWPPMRATPTATPANQSYANGSGFSISPVSPTNATASMTPTAAGNIFCSYDLTLSAEL